MNIYFRFRVVGIFLFILFYIGIFLMPKYAAGAYMNCTKITDQVELLICVDKYLSDLDHKLRDLLVDEMKMASESGRKEIELHQKDWKKMLNDCWKYPEPWNCISNAYQMRIAYLQVQGKRVSFTGPIQYLCNNDVLVRISATFFRTDPPTALLEIPDRKVIAFLQPSGSGAKYETGANSEEHITFWTKGTEAKAARNDIRDIQCIELN